MDINKLPFNVPKRTPDHPTKSHIVRAKVGSIIKILRFGQQGVKGAGKYKPGESSKITARRKAWYARHRDNIKKGKLFPAYWAANVKW